MDLPSGCGLLVGVRVQQAPSGWLFDPRPIACGEDEIRESGSRHVIYCPACAPEVGE